MPHMDDPQVQPTDVYIAVPVATAFNLAELVALNPYIPDNGVFQEHIDDGMLDGSLYVASYSEGYVANYPED